MAIGGGHVMRCLTLAHALRDQGDQIHFLCREHVGHLGALIKAHGFDLTLLPAGKQPSSPPPPHADWLGACWEEDAIVCANALPERVDALIVDHYALDARWESAMRPHAHRIMVIDGLADRPHDADLLLDQNYYEDMDRRYTSWVPPACQLLIGPRYALLRPEFTAVRRAPPPPEPRSQPRVMLFFGCHDHVGLTLRALQELTGMAIEVDVVIGDANSERATIEARCNANGPGWRCFVQIDNMAHRMAQADILIGAGGTTNWERCYLAIPSIVITVAENQVAATRALHEQGGCRWLGPVDKWVPGKLRRTVQQLLASPTDQARLRDAARRIMPPDAGTERVVAALHALTPPSDWPILQTQRLRLRPMHESDTPHVVRWRNAPHVAAMSRTSREQPFTEEEHLDWFRSTRRHRIDYIMELRATGTAIGSLSYILRADPDTGRYGIAGRYIGEPEYQGQGYAKEAAHAWLQFASDTLKLNRVRAQMRSDNHANIAINRALGFRELAPRIQDGGHEWLNMEWRSTT